MTGEKTTNIQEHDDLLIHQKVRSHIFTMSPLLLVWYPWNFDHRHCVSENVGGLRLYIAYLY